MTATKVLSAALLAACLSGCTAGLSGAVSGGSGVVTGLQSTVDTTINQLLMQKKADLHNLTVGLEQIDATPGYVMMVPVVGAVSTTMTVVPITGGGLSTAPPSVPVGPPTVLSPMLPVTPPSTAPTTTTIPPTPIIQ